MSRGSKSVKKSAFRYAIEPLEQRMMLSASVNEAAAVVAPLAVSPTSETTLTQFTSTETTADKPQSKAWTQAGRWWNVMPDSTGTWVWRLDNTTWTKVFQLSTDTAVRADVRNAGDVTHVLLFNENVGLASLASIQLVAGATPTQTWWSARPGIVNVPLANNVNTASIEIDINGRMWVAYDGTSFINVRWSDGNYSTWSNAVQLGGNITSDDIAAISRVGNYGIGVMWSNQNDDKFHFRFHSYLQGGIVWGDDEFPGAGQALNINDGLSDNHIHLVDDVNGNLYAAVKTGYDDNTNTEIGLLVRHANGSWDDMYQVATRGTRPTVAVDQTRDTLIVAYTDNNLVDAQILYKKTSLSNISFSSATTLISGAHNNVTTTKQRTQDGTLVFLADNGAGAVDSTKVTMGASPVTPTPPPPPGNAMPALTQTAMNNITPVTTDTGAQTQSKSWFQANRYWTVLADSSGTWVYRQDGTTWTKVLQLSASTTAVADCRANGSLTHILLWEGATASVATVELVSGATPTYQMWSVAPGLVSVSLTANTRSAMIEIDASGRLWIAYDGNSNLFVQYADASTNYQTWNSPITLASGVTNDDIIAIARVGANDIGVMWSDQNADRFGYRLHHYNDAANVWGADEGPGQFANVAVGNGIADSQIHMATLTDGRLYAVVKTGFNDGAGGLPEIGLLVRNANGTWDHNLYAVDDVGDNAQVVVDPTHNKLVVTYTNSTSSKTNNIVYKVTSLGSINFATGKGTVIPGGWDLVSTVKHRVNGAFPILASNGSADTVASALLTIA